MISVLMSVYKEKKLYVKKAIDSILNQTYKDIELIVVLDAPDNIELLEMLKEYSRKDCRFKPIINNNNIGLAMSLNRAIELAQGEYYARMDADDVSKPCRLEKELDYLVEHGLDVVACTADKIDENDNVWGEIRPFNNDPNLIRELLPIQNVIIHPTVLMKADVIKKIGGYRNYSSCQDYDLWLRLVSNNNVIGILNENLFQFRKHNDSITATKRFNQILNEEYIRRMYEERHKSGSDSYSAEGLKKYLDENGYNDPEKRKFENDKLSQYRVGINLLKRHNIRGISVVFKSLSSRSVRTNIYTSILARVVRRKYKGE